MRYFHRTSITPDEVMTAADRHFAGLDRRSEKRRRMRTYAGSIGQVTVEVTAEGGHYTLINVTTDRVGESEIDRLSKRFFTVVHQLADPAHVARGAY